MVLCNNIMDCYARQLLLSELDTHGPVSVPALADTLGYHPTTVGLHCDSLQSEGYVRHATSSVYEITADGEAYLQELTTMKSEASQKESNGSIEG
jgi:predicted ArsR family transcriptional regulator